MSQEHRELLNGKERETTLKNIFAYIYPIPMVRYETYV